MTTSLKASMAELERFEWKSLEAIVQEFLGKYKADPYKELLQEMLLSLKNFDCIISIK